MGKMGLGISLELEGVLLEHGQRGGSSRPLSAFSLAPEHYHKLVTSSYSSVADAFAQLVGELSSFIFPAGNSVGPANLFLPANFLGASHEQSYDFSGALDGAKPVIERIDPMIWIGAHKGIEDHLSYCYDGVPRGLQLAITLPADSVAVAAAYNTALALDPFGIGTMNSFGNVVVSSWRAYLLRAEGTSLPDTVLPPYVLASSPIPASPALKIGEDQYLLVRGPVLLRKTAGSDDVLLSLSADANPLLSLSSAYADVAHYLVSKAADKGAVVGKGDALGVGRSGGLVLPAHHSLSATTEKAILGGLKDEQVSSYLDSVLVTAEALGYANHTALALLRRVIKTNAVFANRCDLHADGHYAVMFPRPSSMELFHAMVYNVLEREIDAFPANNVVQVTAPQKDLYDQLSA